MNRYVKYIIVVGCLLLFGFISFYVYKGNDFYSDGVVYDFVSNNIISEGMTPFIKIITWFGGIVGITIMSVVSMSMIKEKKINISLAICLVLGVIINNAIKFIFARERPDINPLMIENTYSFPSGHSMMSMILYGYLIYLVYSYLKKIKYKWLIILVLSILIIGIGFTRIYLGVHYVSDVIGGFALGIAYLIIYIDVSLKIIKKI